MCHARRIKTTVPEAGEYAVASTSAGKTYVDQL